VFFTRIRASVTLIVGGCLFYSGLAKAVSPGETLSSLAWAFGPTLATPVFLLLIMIELVLGSLMLCAVAPRRSCAAATFLFLSFIAWILYLQWRDAPVGCGCGIGLFSSAEASLVTDRIWAGARSGILLLFSLIGLLGSELPRHPDVHTTNMKGEIA